MSSKLKREAMDSNKLLEMPSQMPHRHVRYNPNSARLRANDRLLLFNKIHRASHLFTGCKGVLLKTITVHLQNQLYSTVERLYNKIKQNYTHNMSKLRPRS